MGFANFDQQVWLLPGTTCLWQTAQFGHGPVERRPGVRVQHDSRWSMESGGGNSESRSTGFDGGDSKERLSRAMRARPRKAREGHVFREGDPVSVWRQGRRGTTAKVGPCFVILQKGDTVWVIRTLEVQPIPDF